MLSIVWFFFVTLTFACAVVDVTSYRIPNTFVLALLGLFLIVALLHRTEVAWLSHLGAGIMILGAGLFLYAFRQMGAGDVKLLATLALWAGVIPLIPLLFWVSLCGLAGMLIILLLRGWTPWFQSINWLAKDRPLPRLLTKKQGVPYGIGIAPGAIIASFSFPDWLWRF